MKLITNHNPAFSKIYQGTRSIKRTQANNGTRRLFGTQMHINNDSNIKDTLCSSALEKLHPANISTSATAEIIN